MSKKVGDTLESKRDSLSLELIAIPKSELQIETIDTNQQSNPTLGVQSIIRVFQRPQDGLGLSDIVDEQLFADSENESRTGTVRISMQGAIEEDQKLSVRHSPLSLQQMDGTDLKDDEDDFMETYLVMNAELKVRESQAGGRITRNNLGHTSARNLQKESRYISRLEVKSATSIRPFQKKNEQSRSRTNSNQEILTVNEDNFDQYIDRVDRHSVEESFNQYENLEKFLENDKRQAERRQVALKAIHDYKIMAIEQQRSLREDRRHVEFKKQQEANRLISKLRKERQIVKDKNRKKLHEQLERNISRLQQQETNFEIMQAKILLSKAEDRLRKSQELAQIEEYDPTAHLSMRNRNSYSLKPTKALKSLLEQIPENMSIRNSLNKSVLKRVDQKSALKPLHSKNRSKPLYKQFEIRREQQKEKEERERQQKLREHRQQYQVVSFKHLQARALDLSYDEQLKQRQRMARGVPEGLQIVEVIKNESTRSNVDLVNKSKLAVGEQNDTTFGPVHFFKEIQVLGQRQSPTKRVVELDDNLRGKIEKFQYAQSPQLKPNKQSSSKERQQHVQKYSQYVNEINRKSPSFGSPSGRFDADDYKKVFQRQLMREIKEEEEVQKANSNRSKNHHHHRSPQINKEKKYSSPETNHYYLKSALTSKKSKNPKVSSFERALIDNDGQELFKIEPKQIKLPSIYERRRQVAPELPYQGNPHPTMRRQQFLSQENTFNPQLHQISPSPYQQASIFDYRGGANPRSSLSDHSLQNLRLQETQFQPPEVRLQNLFLQSHVGSGFTNGLDGVEAIRNKLEILSSLMV